MEKENKPQDTPVVKTKNFIHPENEKRSVTAPDGSIVEIDPINDYFCQDRPEEYKVR